MSSFASAHMTAADWFSDEHEFRQLCGDAQSQARGESSQDFTAEMVIKAKDRGLQTYVSEKQLAWLCKIADWDMPKRRAVTQNTSKGDAGV
jgi:hypothetical protein